MMVTRDKKNTTHCTHGPQKHWEHTRVMVWLVSFKMLRAKQQS